MPELNRTAVYLRVRHETTFLVWGLPEATIRRAAMGPSRLLLFGQQTPNHSHSFIQTLYSDDACTLEQVSVTKPTHPLRRLEFPSNSLRIPLELPSTETASEKPLSVHVRTVAHKQRTSGYSTFRVAS